MKQLQDCEDGRIPLAIVLGGNEIAKGEVKLRDIEARTDVSICLFNVYTKYQHGRLYA